MFCRQPAQGQPAPKRFYLALISLVTFVVFIFSLLLTSGLVTRSPFNESIWSHRQQNVFLSPPNNTSQRPSNHSFSPANFGLSGAQCELHFPRYFDDISESVRHRRRNHITREDLDIQGNNESNTRVLIYKSDVSPTPLRPKTSLGANMSHESYTLLPTAVLRQTSGPWDFYTASIALFLPTLSAILCLISNLLLGERIGSIQSRPYGA